MERHRGGYCVTKADRKKKKKLLSDKKDVNYSRAVPLVPAQCSRREMRILSSTVSVRSKNIRVAESLESVASIRLLKTFKSADSVL